RRIHSANRKSSNSEGRVITLPKKFGWSGYCLTEDFGTPVGMPSELTKIGGQGYCPAEKSARQ
ncbi:MAG: hypothetical protein RMK89_08935, partial [Armatimonadota bacterium]|nr:hypothetical protein [Armatimonadota bacterium]MDW8143571.1 hypothetical protein [Armatimonadota bacterium]